MANIIFENIAKKYGDTSIIKELNFEIKAHELMVLVGPSGCGKSTTLRMIAGLEEITHGELRIKDKVVNKVEPKDRDVAMVFQSYALYPHMTVRENISFGLRIRKLDAAKIDELVSEAAEVLGLTDLLDRKPKALSGGQRQRVALGRALVRKPSVFLFDEPLSNLDAELRVQMRAEIAHLQKRLNTTAVYVTHDQVEAMTLGDRIAVMNKGEIMQVGAPLDLYEKPKNVFVAGFLGTPPMNLLNVRVEGNQIKNGVFSMDIPAVWQDSLRGFEDKKLILGIRPEHITGANHGDSSGIYCKGVIEIVETLGHEVLIHVLMNEGKEKLVAKLPAHDIPKMGDNIKLELDINAIHLFDAQTEERIIN
ncbi:ABC transporter ATP-binding protein [Pseudomonas sp. HK3]|jgi:multiple sugar transport system ATP-binding protein